MNCKWSRGQLASYTIGAGGGGGGGGGGIR